jgi:KTSC domain
VDYIGVLSSTIAAIAYDERGAVLGVRFLNGREYQYLGVPRYVYQGFVGAPSKGRYFDAFVRKAGYAYSQVG